MLSFLNGIGRPSASGTAQTALALIQQLTFTRASAQTYIDQNSILQSAVIDAPANDIRGLALFRDSKNFHPYSEDLLQWNGNVGNAKTLTAEVAPDGSTDSVYRYNRDRTAASYTQRLGMAKDNANAENMTISIYVKKDNAKYFAMRFSNDGNRADLVVDLDDGSVFLADGTGGMTGATHHITDAGNGWYRFSLSLTTGAASGLQFIISFNESGQRIDGTDTSDSTGGYVWGAQMELGNTATPYIPTFGPTSTRAYPTAEITSADFTEFFNQDGCSFVMDFTPAAIKSGSQILWQIEASDGRIFLELTAASLLIFGIASDAAITYQSLGAIEAGREYRLIVGLENGNIVAALSNGNRITSAKNLPAMTSWSFTKSSFKADWYLKSMLYYDERLTDGALTRFKDFTVEGDSYAEGAGGIGIKQSLLAAGYDPWTSADGGSTLEAAVARLEALMPQNRVVFCDGSVNGHGSIANDIAKYQRAYDATGGNIAFISPILYSNLAGQTDGQYALDLTAAMLLEGWNVVDGNAIARTLSGAIFVDPTDASDAGYSNAAYDALFQADNIHPEQALADALRDAALGLN